MVVAVKHTGKRARTYAKGTSGKQRMGAVAGLVVLAGGVFAYVRGWFPRGNKR